MKLWKAVLFALGTAIVSAAITDAKQEQPVRLTRTWQAIELPRVDWSWTRARIDVVDMEGVCLYVSRAYDTRTPTVIVAVPKTQLPKGAGC